MGGVAHLIYTQGEAFHFGFWITEIPDGVLDFAAIAEA